MIQEILETIFGFRGWEEIHYRKLPRWVKKRFNKWADSFGARPYDQKTYFKGKTFWYKVYCKTIAQGEVEYIFWRKLRRK